jgi:hypothetical protein
MATSATKKKKHSTVRANDLVRADGYFQRSKRPLEILFFLLPLIAFYEIGLILILRSGGSVLTNKAHQALLRAFETFGLDGAKLSLPALSLPGILLVVILLAWHALSRAKWHVDLKTVAGMWFESAFLAIPLFLAVQLVVQAFGSGDPPPALAADGDSIRTLPLSGRIAVAIGAGLYEELIFRMALIAVLHTLFVDALGWKESRGMAVAIVISAVAFVLYHPLQGSPEGGLSAIDWRRAVSLFVVGLWCGGVFAWRGFGIVVGTHAAYDVAALAVE